MLRRNCISQENKIYTEKLINEKRKIIIKVTMKYIYDKKMKCLSSYVMLKVNVSIIRNHKHLGT